MNHKNIIIITLVIILNITILIPPKKANAGVGTGLGIAFAAASPYLLPAALVIGAGALAWGVGSEYGPEVIDYLQPRLESAWNSLTATQQEVAYNKLKNGETLPSSTYEQLGLNVIVDSLGNSAKVETGTYYQQLVGSLDRYTELINGLQRYAKANNLSIKLQRTQITTSTSNDRNFVHTEYKLTTKFLNNVYERYIYFRFDVGKSPSWMWATSITGNSNPSGTTLYIGHDVYIPYSELGGTIADLYFSYTPNINIPQTINAGEINTAWEQVQQTNDYSPLRNIYENSTQLNYTINQSLPQIVDNTNRLVQTNNEIVTQITKSNTFLGDIKTILNSILTKLNTALNATLSELKSMLEAINTNVNKIPTKLTDVITAINAIPTKLNDVITAIREGPQTILDALPEIVGQPGTGTTPELGTITLPELITDAITSIPTRLTEIKNELVIIPGALREIITEVIPDRATDIINELKRIPNSIIDTAEEWIRPSVEEETQPNSWNIFDLLYLLLAVLIASIKVILAFYALLISLRTVPADSSLLPPLVKQGIDFTKNIEFPFFNMTLFTIVGAVVTLLLFIRVFKVLKRTFIEGEAG